MDKMSILSPEHPELLSPELELSPELLMRSLYLSMTCVVMGLLLQVPAVDAAQAEDSHRPIERACAALASLEAHPGEKPSTSLRQALVHLQTAPRLHTRPYAEKEPSEEVRQRLLKDITAVESLLRSIASSQDRITKAPAEEFVTCLELLVQMKEALTKPGAYGNFLCGAGMSHFVASVGLGRVFAEPTLAKRLNAVFAKNCSGWTASWSVLKRSLPEETHGQLRLEEPAESRFEDRLLEILRQPQESEPKPDLQLADSHSAYRAAFEALSELWKREDVTFVLPTVARLFDTTERSYLVAILCMVEYMTSGSVWWSSFLENRDAVPSDYGQFREWLEADKTAPELPVHPMTAKPFQPLVMFGLLLRRDTLAHKGAAFLVPHGQTVLAPKTP
ncbi:MAG: hypothetical protein ISS78_01495 [Phycisphaerae bacterium]|nr:hypothetical protein [Phycisphaerae bacterium]